MKGNASDWERQRRAASRWALGGALLGGLLGLVAFAPAAWLAGAVAAATEQRFLLADARGTIWQGSAVPVLTGGPGSRDASALPGRLAWTLGLEGTALALRARQACCLAGELRLLVQPGLGGLKITLPAPPAAAGPGAHLGQFPASWLAGLGTPWNTLQLGGWLQLSSPGLALESVQGRWVLAGAAEVQMNSLSSRLATLDSLGSYRLSLSGGPASGQNAELRLSTTEGPLRLQGSGQWATSRLRFRGDARADAGAEGALNNLLNIIGRRQGALAVIAIG